MKKPQLKQTAIISASPVIVLFLLFIIYLSRAPVLIVTDLGFIPFYGEKRIKSESLRSSFFLFRRVKTVGIADDAADEIVQMAVSDISRRPYCVIFPFRFSAAARLYHEQFPQIPVVILEGMHSNDSTVSVPESEISNYHVYQTDIEYDFNLAGMAASALNTGNTGQIAIFMESWLQLKAKNSFLDAAGTQDISFFTAFIADEGYPDISCVVIAGTGAGILDIKTKTPVILFTWVDPLLLPGNVAVVFNDSPWAQTVQAVKMVSAGITNGKIKSMLKMVNKSKIDRSTLRKLKK
ncbi:MAG: hypothetical protein FWC19_04770 [Treponema sp.]|nr:hypothetical protein [Treponema sp.]MCL2272102.1 hypothetical protein [Treponema sp.]